MASKDSMRGVNTHNLIRIPISLALSANKTRTDSVILADGGEKPKPQTHGVRPRRFQDAHSGLLATAWSGSQKRAWVPREIPKKHKQEIGDHHDVPDVLGMAKLL